MPRRVWLSVLLSAALAGCAASDEPPSDPVPRFETVLQDDALLLNRPRELPQTIRTLKDLGAGRVRITAAWSEIAPEPNSSRRPAFDASDPGAYDPAAWVNLDRAVKAVTDGGMRPMVDVSFYAPRWALPRADGERPPYRGLPDPEQFALFAEALAKRYPQVRLWTTWNEPNHPEFMRPQWRAGVPVAAHHYRRMHELAYEAIKDVSADNRVLVGGLTSIGSAGQGPTSAIRPLRFVREMACVDQRLRPLALPECRDFRPLKADGFAHHPYMHRRAPDRPLPDPDSVGMADLGRLSKLLAALAQRGRIERRLDVYVTEFGYETEPPDPRRGIPPPLQAAYLQVALAEALARPDVRMHSQFLVRDLYDDRLYQTGLQQPDGRPKPAFRTFGVSFAVRRGTGLGLVRPGRGRRRVCLESQRADGSWAELGPPTLTDADGILRRPGLGPGIYRLRWDRPARAPAYSLPARAD